MAIQKFTIPAAGGRNAFTLYGEQANLAFFFTGPLTPDTAGGVTNYQVTRKAHTRRQYPGDATPINVGGSAAEFLKDPSRRSGTALPGRSIVIVGDQGLPGEERRQFTLKGRWVDFHAWAALNAKMQIQAFNNTGARYTIDKPAGP